MTRRHGGGHQDGPDLLDLLEEASDDPPLCQHASTSVARGSFGWCLEVDPQSRYYGMWVHADPNCYRARILKQERTFIKEG